MKTIKDFQHALGDELDEADEILHLLGIEAGYVDDAMDRVASAAQRVGNNALKLGLLPIRAAAAAVQRTGEPHELRRLVVSVLTECVTLPEPQQPRKPDPDFWTLPQIAKHLGIKADKVLAWIESGELHATNTVQRRNSTRPRWRVLLSDLQAFLKRRSATVSSSPRPPRHSSCPAASRPGVIPFFSQ